MTLGESNPFVSCNLNNVCVTECSLTQLLSGPMSGRWAGGCRVRMSVPALTQSICLLSISITAKLIHYARQTAMMCT